MANGFKALRHVGGGVQRLSERPIADAYTANLFNGDMVTLNAGSVELAVDTDTDVVGTFLGCMYVNAQGSQVFSPYWPASTAGATDRKALINEDAGISYKVECLTGALAVGDTADLANAANGNPKTGQSGMTAVAGDQFTVIRILEVGAVNDLIEVTIA